LAALPAFFETFYVPRQYASKNQPFPTPPALSGRASYSRKNPRDQRQRKKITLLTIFR
jgi:hypothetical protein